MFPVSIADCIGGYDLNYSMEDGFKELSHGKGIDMVEQVIWEIKGVPIHEGY